MPVILKVKSDVAAAKEKREAAAQRVLAYFGLCLPESRLLCFLDDKDWPHFKEKYGAANRGGYVPVKDGNPLAEWPDDVRNCVYARDDLFPYVRRVIDDLIYLHGSTSADEVGLTMTLAHELQHAIQHGKVRKLWVANSLITNLDRAVVDAEKLTWADIPIEREARIISKRAAECLLGEQAVIKYIDGKIAERVSESDIADWRFIRTLTPSSSVDLVTDTQLLLRRVKDYRLELEAVLQEKKDDPDFGDVDLAPYFEST